MPVFEGRNSLGGTQVAANIPSGIMSYSVVMNGSGSLIIYIGQASAYTRIFTGTLVGGDKVYSTSPIQVLAGKSIYLVSSASCDYYFSIE